MKKLRTLLVAVSLAGAMLTACSGGNSSDNPGNPSGATAKPGTETTEQPSGKPVKLDIIETGNNLPSPDKDIIKQELDKALNIDLNLTVYPAADDYNNQLNVRMSSGNFPDLFMVDRQQLIQFSKQGLLLDLTPYMDKLEQTVAFIGEDSVKKGMVDGKVYGISKSPQIPYNTLWIRKDWLNKLKLEVPTTVEQLASVADAFTKNDPDGNGKPDTFGLTGSKLSAFSTVFGAFGVGMPGNFYEKDGKVVNALHEPAMKDALAFIKDMIGSGSVDPSCWPTAVCSIRRRRSKGRRASSISIGRT